MPTMSPASALSTAAEIGAAVARRLNEERDRLRAQWESSKPVHHFFIDDVLPAEHVLALYRNMPERGMLASKHTLRESKAVGVEVERYHPSVGAHLYGFQEPGVLDAITAITGIRDMHADPSLYASGVSLMQHGDFLNPHLDNSHDGDQREYRVLNLLYYVSPDWQLENGGNLELWTDALDVPTVILSKFNRLVVMETSPTSWHSVQPVTAHASRYCVSNYYFSPHSSTSSEYRNVTSFRGRPEQGLARFVLWLDGTTRNILGKLMPSFMTHSKHRRR